MNAKVLNRSFSMVIVSVFTAIMISACGSSGSSSSGGGGSAAGTASISGNVSGGLVFNRPSQRDAGLLTAVFELTVPVAQASGVSGVTVLLTGPGGTTQTTSTNGSGDFSFNNLAPGDYTVQLPDSGGAVTPISLAANTSTRLELTMDGSVLEMDVAASQSTSISGEVEDQNSSDDAVSSDDQDSEDDQSADDPDSEDDISEDDVADNDSADDDSNDDDDDSNES